MRVTIMRPHHFNPHLDQTKSLDTRIITHCERKLNTLNLQSYWILWLHQVNGLWKNIKSMVKVKWVWRILTTWYDPKRNQWLSTWWHLLKLRCSLYTSQDIEDVVVVGYSNNKMKVMTISFLWVSLEQWGVQNGIVSLIYLEQPRLDFPVFQLGLYCPWKWEKVNDLNNLLDYHINSLGD